MNTIPSAVSFRWAIKIWKSFVSLVRCLELILSATSQRTMFAHPLNIIPHNRCCDVVVYCLKLPSSRIELDSSLPINCKALPPVYGVGVIRCCGAGLDLSVGGAIPVIKEPVPRLARRAFEKDFQPG